MSYPQTPPPFPGKQTSLGVKILLLGLQCALLMIGAFAIWLMSFSHEQRNKDVSEEIFSEWGSPICIRGPIVDKDSSAWISPQSFVCDATVHTQSLHRNIYEAEVYNSGIKISGTFNKERFAALGDSIFVKIILSTDQLTKLGPLKIGNRTITWMKSEDFLYASVNVAEMPETIPFSTEFDIKGSEHLYITPIGKESLIKIAGDAPNPSFQGRVLPNERKIHDGQFSATWEGEGIPETFKFDDSLKFVGTDFLVGVDRYQKVSRSLKYSFMIILLTYICVLFTEIIIRKHIPLLNYFLIGVALILFYSLLLSITEHLSFGVSYLIAAFMTVALITSYMWKMLRSRKIGLTIGAILTGLYICCYIMLSLSSYALLVGSLILFMALGAMMYGSLKVRNTHL